MDRDDVSPDPFIGRIVPLTTGDDAGAITSEALRALAEEISPPQRAATRQAAAHLAGRQPEHADAACCERNECFPSATRAGQDGGWRSAGAGRAFGSGMGAREMTAAAEHPHGVKQRLAAEMREYLALSLYLCVCLGAVFFYRAALLEDHGIGYVEFGTAAVKALVLAKFAMLGRMAGVGEVREGMALIPAVLRASLGMLLVLVALTAVEELVVGALRHSGPEGALAEIATGRWAEVAAGVLLLWLMLMPYLAFRHLQAALGADATRRLIAGGG